MLLKCVVAVASPTAELRPRRNNKFRASHTNCLMKMAHRQSKAKLLAMTSLSEDSTTNTNPASQKMAKPFF